MSRVGRGRLAHPSAAPAAGELTKEVVRIGEVVVEQILSGRLEGAIDDRQDQAELALVLDGAAVLEVEGERIELMAGDWVLLPPATPHRLVWTEPGTNWLTVHVPAAP